MLPYYHQLKQILLEAVQEQRLHAGDLLPGDHDLAEHYALSRSVVRQALSELETEGLIVRQRGKGTFLAREKVSEGLARWIGGLADDVDRRGASVASRVIRCEVVSADSRVAALLELDEGEAVVTLERVRSVDGEPWVHTTTWLPNALFPGLAAVDFTDQSLYALLRSHYEVVFGTVKRSVEATLAGEVTAHYLGIDAADPVLRLSSVATDATGRPIETFVAFHRGDRSRFDVELRADEVVGGAVALRAAMDTA